MSELIVEVTRGPIVESRHRGDVAVVDSSGRLLYSAGDPDLVTYLRSAAKPIQALPIVESGAADRFGLTPAELAAACSSHNAEPGQMDTILGILRKIGLEESYLQCGTHTPLDRETAAQLIREGKKPSPIHSNCSGKHAGMLAMTVHLGFPQEGYRQARHELQQMILDTMAEVTGVPRDRVVIGVDGCGVPVFGIPVWNMAYAYARLADPARLPESKREAARRIVDAVQSYPDLIAGKSRLDTDLMKVAGRKLVAKSGFEGVYCVGLLPGAAKAPGVDPDLGVGVAVKAEDGSTRASYTAAVEALRQLGALNDDELAALGKYTRPAVKNFHGEVCGEIRAAFELRRA